MKTFGKNKERRSILSSVCVVFLLVSLSIIFFVQSTWADKKGKVSIFGLTEPGHNVVIELTDLSSEDNIVKVTFSEIQTEGITKLKKTDVGTLPLPSNLKLRNEPIYYSIVTTAEYKNDIRLCINYKGKDSMNEGALRILHLTNGLWEELKTDLDYKNNIICGTTTTLSDFVLLEDPRYVYGPYFWSYQAIKVRR